MRLFAFVFLLSSVSSATPSSNLWAPSTAMCQPFALPHVTYDSYFRKGPGLSSGAPSAYPTTYGLTAGFLPFDKIQGEAGWDMALPGEDPHSVNGKVCAPDSAFFAGAPALSAGVYGVGFRKNVNDYNIAYVMVQKNFAFGSLAVGGYHGGNKRLFTNSDGKVVQDGLLAAFVTPDLEIGLKGLRKINFLADLQTGKNAFGAWALGSNVYFADHVSLLVGPVFFFDRKAQPNGADMLWAVELDIDIPLGRL